jgi:hypothetical protein
MSIFDDVTEPFPIVRSAFENAADRSIRAKNLHDLIASVALQSASDGRVLVLVDKRAFSGNLVQLCDSYLSYFQPLNVQVISTIDGVSQYVVWPISFSPEASSITVSICEYVNCSATFTYGSELPSDATYPLVCLGFPAPKESSRLRRDFEQFVREREFPYLDLRAISNRRTELERRNRDYLLKKAKKRQTVVQRYDSASQLLQKRNRQLRILQEQIGNLAPARPATPASARLQNIERTIDKIESQINQLMNYAEALSKEADEVAGGRPMTRREELALLQALKKQVGENRQQLEALNEQV